jgi:hypothetical protein
MGFGKTSPYSSGIELWKASRLESKAMIVHVQLVGISLYHIETSRMREYVRVVTKDYIGN